MNADFAVVLEGGGDRQAGCERTAEAVDKDIDLLALVLGKLLVNGSAVEVVASDVAFERYIVSGLRYNLVDLHHEVTHLIIWLKRLEMSRKISNFAA